MMNCFISPLRIWKMIIINNFYWNIFLIIFNKKIFWGDSIFVNYFLIILFIENYKYFNKKINFFLTFEFFKYLIFFQNYN